MKEPCKDAKEHAASRPKFLLTRSFSLPTPRNGTRAEAVFNDRGYWVFRYAFDASTVSQTLPRLL